MNLYEAFRADNSRVHITVMFVDMVNSAGRKSNQREAEWLNTLGKFLDVITQCCLELSGTIIKYMGDGAMVTFPNSDTAINAAIKIQEGVADLREKNIADVSCTVGITSGTVISFETSHGKDYVGTVVDTAARLQSAAKEHGILVSKTVFSSGLMNKITSTYGSAIKRKPEEYIAQVDKIKLKGINGEVEYCEILWSDKYFGIKETIKKAEDPKG